MSDVERRNARQSGASDDQRRQPAAQLELASPLFGDARAGALAPFADNRPQASAQRKLAAAVQQSPRLLTQRRQIESLAGVAQRHEAAPAKTNNTGLPDNLKSGIESLSGMSMDGVKVHYNSSQPAQLNALAYAQGSDIHVAPGQEQHLPHEAWHVVQQAQGRVKPTMQMKEGVPVNDDQGLEHEADVMGARALQQGSALHTGTGSANPVQKVDAEHAPKLREAYEQALADKGEGTLNQKYIQHLASKDYPFEDDECERPHDAPAQLKRATIQFARAAYSISGPKSYGGLNNIVYQTDALGNIDFSHPSQYYIGNPYPGGYDPVDHASLVDITGAVQNYGTNDRYQHFKDANQQKPNYGGVNGSSPGGLTWHHLTQKYYMHLVDRTVHSKHGHNGGVHIW